MKISIVINNFNYAGFLSECIESALAQTYADTEVVVVDDGSTDGSSKIIRSYGNRILCLLKDNGGQGSAINSGFSHCSGDWVIFVDADDKLSPLAAERVANVIAPKISNVQYYLSVIDAASKEIGVSLPTRPLHDGDVRPLLARFRYYNSPPSSGNAYSRDYLVKVLPMPESNWRIAADAYLILGAPFHGEIRSIHQPLGFYRRHGKGASDVGRSSRELLIYVTQEIEKEERRERYVQSLLLEHDYKGNIYSYTFPTLCKHKIVAARLGDSRLSIARRFGLFKEAMECALAWPSYTVAHRVIFIGWCLIILTLPASYVTRFAHKTMLPHWRALTILHKFW